MLYKEKILNALKNETNVINKMYLNELLINWNKVENAIAENNDSPISTMITAISAFTKILEAPKFKYNQEKKGGFNDDHCIFQASYLYDIVDVIINHAGINNDEEQGLLIRNNSFQTGFKLQRNSFTKNVDKPRYEILNSQKCLHVALEFEHSIKLISKKNHFKTKLYIPLICFYIEKVFTKRSAELIIQLKEDAAKLNQNAVVWAVTETIDKKYLDQFIDFEDFLFVLRPNKNENEFNELQPMVALNLLDKLTKFITKDDNAIEHILHYGCLDLIKSKNKVEDDDNTKKKRGRPPKDM